MTHTLLSQGLAAATAIWSLVPATCQAQGGRTGSMPAASTANAHPTWNELNAIQQRVLAPLAGEWNNFPELNRRKWLQIAERYEKFSPAEQARLVRELGCDSAQGFFFSQPLDAVKTRLLLQGGVLDVV